MLAVVTEFLISTSEKGEYVMNFGAIPRIVIVSSFLFTFNFSSLTSLSYNINLIGHVKSSSSISSHTVSIIECLYPEINPNLFKSIPCSAQGLPPYFKKIINQGISIPYTGKIQSSLRNKNLTGISIYADSIVEHFWKQYIKLPNKSIIKLAYCVTERTMVTPKWINRLNQHFDAIIVPDQWLVEVFKNSGLNIPIFTLPIALNLNSLLNQPIRKKEQTPFIFGFSGGWWDRKNHKLLIQAFAEEFGNNPNVMLKIHGRMSSGFKNIAHFHAQQNASNILLEQKLLSRNAFESFLASLHCYITVAKGEGFSIIPRQVLALATPCIVSNNTAQITICDSGCVYSVPSNILEPSYLIHGRELSGYDFNCAIDDVKKALRSVYENYDHYCALAVQGREWVKQYLPQNLKNKYMTLVAPKVVILGNCNQITDEFIMTDCISLFEKYKKLLKKSSTIFKKIDTKDKIDTKE